MLEGKEFYSTINFYNLVFKSCTPQWMEASDLKQTKSENKREDKITLFKQLTIGNVLGERCKQTKKTIYICVYIYIYMCVYI